MTKGRARANKAPGRAPAAGAGRVPAVAPRAPRRRAPAPPAVSVSKPGDHHEREADAAADRIVAGRKAMALSPVGSSVGREAEETEDVQAQSEDEEVQKADGTEAAGEEEVQKAQDETAGEEEVQKAEGTEAAEEEPVQAKADEEGEIPSVQAKAAGGASAPSAAAAKAIASPGPGRAMDPGTRAQVESGLGTDLSRVRVHDDASANESARALNARAFTHGNDIWLGRGESDRDLHLMSHESAHVSQQRGGVARLVVQRAGKAEAKQQPPVPSPWKSDNGQYALDTSTKTARIPQLTLPDIKAEILPKTNVEFEYGRERETGQRVNWDTAVAATAASKVDGHLAKDCLLYTSPSPRDS